MKHTIIASAIALAIAAPASAGDQLARSLGLEPGAFTLAELATIKGGRESGDSTDREGARAFETLSAGTAAPTRRDGTRGDAQLAANLGLDDSYSTAELATIKGIAEEHDSSAAGAIAYRLDVGASGFVSTQSIGTPAAKDQLASFLGVDPADYSLAELAEMKGEREGED